MAQVVISNTYFLALDPKQEDNMQPYPPLGTLYAAAVLEKKGHSISFFDAIFASSHEKIFPLLAQHAGSIFVICDDGFNYLTKMCLVNMRTACFGMIHHAKKLGYTVIVSSSDATDHWKEYLNEGADFILIGEVEKTLLELTSKITSSDFKPEEINGLAFKANDVASKTLAREVVHDLDSLPMPSWHLIEMEKYKKRWLNKSGYFSLNITTTRGCPFKCNWCAKPIYGNRYNSRSPENVLEEIEHLIVNYGVEHFWFCDDIFGLKPGWIKKFSELVVRKNLSFRFKIQCRADLLLDDENIGHLAATGCDEIWIGAESGSQKVLDAMDKGTKVEQIYTSTRLMKQHGIKPCFFLQFGYPDEQKEDIDLTTKMLFELMPHDIGISVSYPLPGTKFYERVKEELEVKQNWNDSDELLLMYKSTFTPAYYKQLHKYVHQKFRLAQGIQFIKGFITGKAGNSKKSMRRVITIPLFFISTKISKYKLRAESN